MRNTFFPAYWFWHCGEGFQTILLMWYMAFHANLSATEIGFYQSLQLAPFLVFTALGGSVTDRVGARLSFAAATGSFALALGFYGIIEPRIGFVGPVFAAYCLLSGFLSAIANPAIDTFIPDATPHPPTRNALIAATVHNVAKLSGNTASLLLPTLAAKSGFMVNGLLMAVSVGLLLAHRGVARPARVASGRAKAMARVRTHFRAHPECFDILLASAMLGLILVPSFYIFQPLTLRTWYPEHAGLIGLVGVAGWIGAIIATGLAARLASGIRQPGKVALLIWAAIAFGFLALPLSPNLAVFLLLMGLLGGHILGKALIYGHYLHAAPAEDRALLIGIDQTALWGMATVGTFGLGWVVDQVGMNGALAISSGSLLAGTALLAARGRLISLSQA